MSDVGIAMSDFRFLSSGETERTFETVICSICPLEQEYQQKIWVYKILVRQDNKRM
jgi:hypothetical protein